MLYTNAKSGKSFYGGSKTPSGKFYPKNVSLFCHKHNGFGIDVDLFQSRVVEDGRQGIDFKVREDLMDFRRGKVVCPAGTYRISLDKIQQVGVRDVLNSRFGEQLFISVDDCEKVG